MYIFDLKNIIRFESVAPTANTIVHIRVILVFLRVTYDPKNKTGENTSMAATDQWLVSYSKGINVGTNVLLSIAKPTFIIPKHDQHFFFY